MKLREKILFKITEIFLKKEKGIKLEGPLFYQNSLDRVMIEKAIHFRTTQNLIRAPHLEDDFQQKIESELQIDQRSAHFIALKNNEIVICLRLTPGPFELSALSDDLKEVESSHKGFWEFSRLCTDIKLPVKGKVAKLLLIKGGLWLFSETKARGIIAICQENKVKFMSKFALYPEKSKISLNHRSGHYTLLSAPRQAILFRFMKDFFKDQKSKKLSTQTQLAT